MEPDFATLVGKFMYHFGALELSTLNSTRNRGNDAILSSPRVINSWASEEAILRGTCL